jgi:hypothetical protein
LGAERNFDLAARASTTPWTWLMGDDDEVTAGSVKFVADRLKTLPEDIRFATILVNVYTSDLEHLLIDFGHEYHQDIVWQGVNKASARFYNKYHFIGNHIFRTEMWAATPQLEQYIGSQLVQLFFILHWIGQHEKIAFFNRVCIHQRYNNSFPNEETLFETYKGALSTRSKMVCEVFWDQASQRAMLDAFFQPYALFSYKKCLPPLSMGRSLELFKYGLKYYSWSPRFWLYYPIELLLPPVAARGAKQMIDRWRIFKNKGNAGAGLD